MGALDLGEGQEAASRLVFEGEDLDRWVTVYRVRIFLAPNWEFSGIVSFRKGQWLAAASVNGNEILRRADIWSFSKAKARVDREYRKVWIKFLEWLNASLFEAR